MSFGSFGARRKLGSKEVGAMNRRQRRGVAKANGLKNIAGTNRPYVNPKKNKKPMGH